MSKVLMEYSEKYKIYFVENEEGYFNERYPKFVEIELSDTELAFVEKVFSDFNKCQEFLESKAEERVRILENECPKF